MGVASLRRNIRTKPASQDIVFHTAGFRELRRGKYKSVSVHHRA